MDSLSWTLTRVNLSLHSICKKLLIGLWVHGKIETGLAVCLRTPKNEQNERLGKLSRIQEGSCFPFF